MKFFIGVTDNNWFKFLSERDPDEVNFWLPSSKQGFSALERGEPFLFKLHSPHNFIAGGGFFVTYHKMPVSVAWSAFGEKNGVASESALKQAINSKRAHPEFDPVIGNVILTQPFFFRRSDWIAAPEDWKRNIVRGKSYDTREPIGANVWREVETRLQSHDAIRQVADRPSRRPVRSPLGSGAFTVLVTEAYQRSCAITGERTLPVLQATHIKPLHESGINETNNGLLLRADMHILFDCGYVTVTPDHRIEVSRRIKEEYENGRDYYTLHGKSLATLPQDKKDCPDKQFLAWHNERAFLG